MKKKNKKSKQKKQQLKKQKNFSELFDKIINYKYLGIVLAAINFVGMLFISLMYHKVADYGVETDFFWGYVPHAKKFLSGIIEIDSFRGPVYPAVLGIVKLITSDFFVAGVLIAVLSASFVIFFTFEIQKRIFSPAIAFVVTLLLAFNPIFVQYSYSAGTDMFFGAIVTSAIYFFFKNKQVNYKNIMIAAFLSGLAYLTRYNGVFLLGLIFIILFVNYWNLIWAKRLKISAIFFVVFFITITPWGIYCLSKKGSFFYNENYKNIAYELYGKGKIQWDKFWFKESNQFSSLTDVIKRDPEKFTSKMSANVVSHFMYDMQRLMGWFVGAFVALGILLLLIRNPKKYWKSRENAYYLMNIFFFGILLLVFYSERFSIFLIPFYAVIAVQPFLREEFKLTRKIPKTAGYVILIALCVITLSKSISFNSSRIFSGPRQMLVMRDWFEKNMPGLESGKKIAARKPHVAYYLNMDFYLLPLVNSYEELISKLRKDKVDYLFFSPMEAMVRRKMEYLLDPKSNHPGLKVVLYFKNPPAVLYKVE